MNFKRVFFNFLLLSLISYTTLSIFYSAVSFNWTYQDWNINYDGGFVRRGLGGEILSFIKKFFYEEDLQLYFGVPINFTYFYVLSLINLIFYLLFLNFFKNVNLNFTNFFIIFSPISLPFVIYNTGAIARKEILLFIGFLIFIYTLRSFYNKRNSIVFLIFFFPLMILIHEGMIFFILIFVILFFLSIKRNIRKTDISLVSIFILISIFFFIITIINKGETIHVLSICQNLDYIKNCRTFSAISMLSDDQTLISTFNLLWERIFSNKYLIYYPLISILAFYPLCKNSSYYFFEISFKNKVIKINFLFIVLILFLNTLPLYIFTFDWGRWLNITYILLMLTFYFLKDSDVLICKKTYKQNIYVKNNNFLKKFILIFIMLFYSLGINISYFNGYNKWILNYKTIGDKLNFKLRLIKTIPKLF
tara:strand:+ start:1076 stop:2335 length:1260 start_codon:yes stop_codon:yes gene_type:complete